MDQNPHSSSFGPQEASREPAALGSPGGGGIPGCRTAGWRVASRPAATTQGWQASGSWRSAQRHHGLLPSWQTHRGRAPVAQQRAEYGFGLLSEQIKAAAEARSSGAVWAYK